jgi:hypothetical protein
VARKADDSNIVGLKMTQKKIFVLANSIKKQQRCVAGIEIVKGLDGKEDWGEWIRPVTHHDEGAISLSECRLQGGTGPVPFDVIQIPLTSCEKTLRSHGIKYVFLGKELGARRTEEECYINGKVFYDLVYKTEAFQDGIRRLMNGLSKMRVALLCAEKDPLDCHRAILICRYMRNKIVHIKHILRNGKTEGITLNWKCVS